MTAADFAHTPVANENRQVKARAIAAWCWDRGVGAGELAGYDPKVLGKIGRAAGVAAPSPETASVAVDLLDTKEEWAERHPDAPAAARAGLDRPDWLPAPRPVLVSVPTLPPVAEYVKPRGWDALAALGPLPREHDAPCHVCGAAPVVITLAHAHCAEHPPQPPTGDRPGQWGWGLNWTPTHATGKCPAGVCWCGRCGQCPKPARRRDHVGAVA